MRHAPSPRLLRLEEQFRMLDGLVGALLRSRHGGPEEPRPRVPTPQANPTIPARLPLFEALFAALRAGTWPDRPDAASALTGVPKRLLSSNATYPNTAFPNTAFQNAAFFDAYFSNYIEGTEFPVEDRLIRIVFQRRDPGRTGQPTPTTCSGPIAWSQAGSEMHHRPAELRGVRGDC